MQDPVEQALEWNCNNVTSDVEITLQLGILD